MSDMRVCDPNKLHLKKELIQIRKASRVLRDPGTTSSWRSPLASSSRSVAAQPKTSASSYSAWKLSNSEIENVKGFQANSRLDPLGQSTNENEKKKRIFLYNWKNPKSSSEKSDKAKTKDFDEDEEEQEDDGNDGSSSYAGGSIYDSLSDARNGKDVDSNSDTYLGDSHGRMTFRRRDANLVPLGMPTFKKRSKKIDTRLDAFSKYKQKDIYFARKLANSRRLLEGHPSMASEMSQDDSIGQSDDTDDYCQSEDVRRVTGTSPLLLKLKHKNWPRSSSKFLRGRRRDDSSYSYSTPALSTSSYNGYRKRNPSTVGSWDCTTTSMNDVDDEVDDHLNLPGRQGCGIPCYWSKRTLRQQRGMCGSCYSPSLSDTLRRKGSSLLCGSQNMYARRRQSSMSSGKRRIASKSFQGVLPLLANSGNGRGGSSLGTGRSDDELSTNFGELDLEALSRLDGRRWSSCRSQEGLEIVALNGEGEEEATPENLKSFSQKYKPMFFGDLIGQNIVVQSLINSMSRGRIAPVYLFQGPRGTGKSSAARIFASALNCLAPDVSRPCGYCRECTNFISGKSMDLFEVDGTNKKGIDKVRYLFKNLLMRPSQASSRSKVFIIDECHLLPSKTWLAFLKFVEDPPPRVVFIFITTDIDNVPCTIQSRCQKYIFNKIKDTDIVARLRKISAEESLEVESDALNLIALNVDGSLRDAETMLEQLSLLGKKISKCLVNELVGIVSDEKLLELLEFAMSSNTAETVKRAREFMDAGVDPMILMSQLASLIMDIIAGTYNNGKHGSLFDERNCEFNPFTLSPKSQQVTAAEIKRLKHALKLLSEAEKQLRISNERSTWFTATLLQLGSVPSSDPSHSGSSRRQSWRTEDDPSSTSREANRQKSDGKFMPHNPISPAMKKAGNDNMRHQGDLLSQSDDLSSSSKLSHSQFQDGDFLTASHDNPAIGNKVLKCVDSEKLDNIWTRCIEKCHSKTLRQLLHAHGKLVSISEVEGLLIAYIAFSDGTIKSRAERFLSSITNSIEVVLRCNVEVRIIHLPGGEASLIIDDSKLPGDLKQADAINGYSGCYQLLNGTYKPMSGSSALPGEGDTETSDKIEKREGIPMQRIESIIREQRLETAWLQATEKGTLGSVSCLKPEKNQVLPQDGTYIDDQTGSVNSLGLSSRQWRDEVNHELKGLKINAREVIQKDLIGKRIDHFPMSPSLLHDPSFINNSGKNNLGYESGSNAGGCSGLFCWNSTKHNRRGKVKRNPVRAVQGGRFALFGDCSK